MNLLVASLLISHSCPQLFLWCPQAQVFLEAGKGCLRNQSARYSHPRYSANILCLSLSPQVTADSQNSPRDSRGTLHMPVRTPVSLLSAKSWSYVKVRRIVLFSTLYFNSYQSPKGVPHMSSVLHIPSWKTISSMSVSDFSSEGLKNNLI
jgi:hypothetical protein